MRVKHPTFVALGVVTSLLLAFVLMFVLAFSRHSQSTAPITNDDWSYLSNTRIMNWSIRVAQNPFGQEIRTPTEEEFRRVLKLLMPFEATTELRVDHFDYELIYQGGTDPTHIYIDTSRNDLRFWINARPTVYRSQSRDVFLNALKPFVHESAEHIEGVE